MPCSFQIFSSLQILPIIGYLWSYLNYTCFEQGIWLELSSIGGLIWLGQYPGIGYSTILTVVGSTLISLIHLSFPGLKVKYGCFSYALYITLLQYAMALTMRLEVLLTCFQDPKCAL